jgi:hypothetical protein
MGVKYISYPEGGTRIEGKFLTPYSHTETYTRIALISSIRFHSPCRWQLQYKPECVDSFNIRLGLTPKAEVVCMYEDGP